jgi:excisionase family DNA binding protein
MTMQEVANNIDQALYTVAQAATALNIGRTHAYRAIKAGKIGSVRIGNKILVPKAEIDRIVAQGVGG